MKLFSSFSIFALLAILISFSACDDDPVIPPTPELITTLTYTLTPDGGGTPVVLSFQDLDGDGPDAPTKTAGILSENTTYTGTMSLLNELETPAEDIGEEVLEEGAEHQFFFSQTVDGLTVAYGDTDVEGRPIGLATTLTTTSVGSGTLTIILRHEPAKDAANVADGDITNAGGETDIEVTFDIDVQ